MSAATHSTLASFSVDRYRQFGYHLISSALSGRDVAAALAKLRSFDEADDLPPSYEPEYEPGTPRRLRKVRRLMWNEPEFWGPMLRRSGALSLAQELVGDDASVIFHASFLKPARVGTPIAPHQDQALWSYTYPGAFSLWFALSDVSPANGGLFGCPRSHAGGELRHRDRTWYPWHPCLDIDEDGLAAPEQFVLAAGDAVAWDRYLVHGSGPNESAADRVGMVIVFADLSGAQFDGRDRFAVKELCDAE